jgi:tetratricopeptide (TPR) repeat protein
MKTLLLAVALCTMPGGDREAGLRLYQEGRFAEAAAAFRAALAQDGDDADLHWNLALASWRAGDLATAETEAEKYAALAPAARVDLHRGLLGAVRHGEAQALEAEADRLLAGAVAPSATAAPDGKPAEPLALLQAALQKATQAKDHFVAGAAARPTPELQRNTERTLRYMAALQAKIEALQQQQPEPPAEPSPDQQAEPPPEQPPEQQGEEPGEQQPEPQPQQPAGPPPDQPSDQPSEQAPEPQPQQRGDERGEQPAAPQPQQSAPAPSDQAAPGEATEAKELSPEQTQRLLEQLRQLDQRLQQLRLRGKTGRRPVERDW